MKDVIERQRSFDAAHGWDWRNLPIDKQIEKLQYCTIALAGELGEVADPLKKFLRKSERGGIDLADFENVKTKLREELIDIFIYLMKMADVVGIDFEAAYFEKMAANEQKHASFVIGTQAKKYDKLVRDKIPAIIASDGKNAKLRVATDKEYPIYLSKKLKEEAEEFSKNPGIEELVDIVEVVNALAMAHNIDPRALDKIRAKKLDERGGFSMRIILEETD